MLAHTVTPTLKTWQPRLLQLGLHFKQGVSLKKVNNLDIYPVLAKVMGLKLLNKVDGDGKTLMPAIKQKVVVH